MSIAIIGMLDEREEGLELLKDHIEARGHKSVLIDITIGTGAIEPTLRADITTDEVARAGGRSIEEIKAMPTKERDKVTSVMAEGLPFAVGRTTIYVNQRDVALAVSKVLFASEDRLGELDPGDMSESQEEMLERAGNVDVIFYSGGEGGTLGHSYYQAPAILADLFLLYEGKLPGWPGGRPLERFGDSMWIIDDEYLRE